jgi:restriction endonuclease Mrr
VRCEKTLAHVQSGWAPKQGLLRDEVSQKQQAKKCLEQTMRLVHLRMIFQGLEECAMVSKLERERSALAAAEKVLEERRQKLAELEREEAERELNRLIKKVGHDTAIALLELAVKVKPKVAISTLEKLSG